MKRGIENTAGVRGSEQKPRSTIPLIALLHQWQLNVVTGAFATSPLGTPQVESRKVDLGGVVLSTQRRDGGRLTHTPRESAVLWGAALLPDVASPRSSALTGTDRGAAAVGAGPGDRTRVAPRPRQCRGVVPSGRTHALLAREGGRPRVCGARRGKRAAGPSHLRPTSALVGGPHPLGPLRQQSLPRDRVPAAARPHGRTRLDARTRQPRRPRRPPGPRTAATIGDHGGTATDGHRRRSRARGWRAPTQQAWTSPAGAPARAAGRTCRAAASGS